jgi:hypothetical protein
MSIFDCLMNSEIEFLRDCFKGGPDFLRVEVHGGVENFKKYDHLERKSV